MSMLLNLKNLIVSELRYSDPRLRRGIVNVLNSIDNDISINGYIPSSDTDEAQEALDKILIEQDQQKFPDRIDNPDELIVIVPKNKPENGYNDLSEEEKQ